MKDMKIDPAVKKLLSAKKISWFDLLEVKKLYKDYFDYSKEEIQGIAQFIEFTKELLYNNQF